MVHLGVKTVMVTYPLIRFVCKFGRKLSLISFFIGLCFSCITAFVMKSYVLFVGLAVFSLVLGLVLRLVSEIVEVVADALLPR